MMMLDEDREKKRGLYFLSGLVLVLLMVIGAMQWGIEYSGSPTVIPQSRALADPFEMPITRTDLKPEQKPRKLTRPKPSASDVFKPVDELPVDQPGNLFDDPIENPVEIGTEGLGDEEIETIEMVFLQHIAVPVECGQEATKEDKLRCMNEWIRQYVQRHVRYPETARRMNLQDKVFLSFVVSEKGAIQEVEILAGEYPILNQEAVRVLSSMPEWLPARQFTQNVKMKMRVPVNFKSL